MARHRRTLRLVVALLATTLACTDDDDGGAGAPTGPVPTELAVTVAPEVARADEPLAVAIEAAAAVTVTVASTDDASRATTDLLTTLAVEGGEDVLYAWGEDPRTFTVEVTDEAGAE